MFIVICLQKLPDNNASILLLVCHAADFCWHTYILATSTLLNLSSMSSSGQWNGASLLSLRSCGKINGGKISHSLVITPRAMILTGYLMFITHGTCFWDTASHRLVCVLTIQSWEKFVLSKKNQSMFDWNGCLGLFKSFMAQHSLFSLLFWDKNWLGISQLVWGIHVAFMYYLPDKHLGHSYAYGDGSDSHKKIVHSHGLRLKNKLFRSSLLMRTFCKNIASYLPFVITNRLFQLFPNPKHSSQFDAAKLWKVRIKASGVDAKQVVTKFLTKWVVSWCCAFFTSCVRLTLLFCVVNNKKQTSK